MPHRRGPQAAARDKAQPTEGAGGVVLVERTIRLLGSFTGKEPSLSLKELSTRAQQNKSTALRVARALAAAQYLVQLDDKTWRLGPAAGWLGATYQQSFDLNDVVMPLLKKLAQGCGLTASFFVRESNTRSCVYRVEGPKDARPSVRPGTAFPLAKGAPGRVILAFSGEPGAQYEAIRRRGFCIGIRERSTDDASVSAPVFGANWQLVGAISLSGSASALSERDLVALADTVVKAAQAASRSLGGRYVRRTR
ncbi:IclR family transcriptional regulator [Ideonella sp.]|uniref:IclR family transcriptional regulator n=1 Tax=Ideonella sp. TaxID=1929293 RepID=UPI0039C88A4B